MSVSEHFLIERLLSYTVSALGRMLCSASLTPKVELMLENFSFYTRKHIQPHKNLCLQAREFEEQYCEVFALVYEFEWRSIRVDPPLPTLDDTSCNFTMPSSETNNMTTSVTGLIPALLAAIPDKLTSLDMILILLNDDWDRLRWNTQSKRARLMDEILSASLMSDSGTPPLVTVKCLFRAGDIDDLEKYTSQAMENWTCGVPGCNPHESSLYIEVDAHGNFVGKLVSYHRVLR